MNKKSKNEHELLVQAVKEILERDDIEIQKSLVSASEISNKFDINNINSIAITVSKLMNLHGASVSDINLYSLFKSYFLDDEKRNTINEIIGEGWRNRY